MVKTFHGADNEFAASTGRNVSSGQGRSTFDNPPNGSKDLVITSNPGDPNPNQFVLGETYDVSWGGQGGGGTIEDAVVIRSDAAPGQGGVIVFEGTDENGDPAQIVWTPDFDLEGWYWANYNPSSEPGFYTSDTNSRYTHSVVCFAAETAILTPDGPRLISRIAPGDYVWTLDAGYKAVLWVGQKTVPGLGRNTPVLFAPGTIGNHTPIRLSQQHRVHVASPLAELFFASHEVLAPAKAFAGQDGITFAPCGEVAYVHLLLEQHHILQADGALCESLLLGDEADDILCDVLPDRVRHLRHSHRAARPVLTYREARSIIGSRVPRPLDVVL